MVAVLLVHIGARFNQSLDDLFMTLVQSVSTHVKTMPSHNMGGDDEQNNWRRSVLEFHRHQED